MISSIIAFLVMMNPFALFLYLEPVRKDLNLKHYKEVLYKATTISFFICLFFFYAGNFIFHNVLQINFESFRIFGGIIIFSFAYHFIVNGHKALIRIKENLDDLASEIALPFMIGAGTISLSILLSQTMNLYSGTLSLMIIFGLNLAILIGLTKLRRDIDKKKIRVAFDKNMEILLRLNGFFIGAIGVDMIVTGMTKLFF